MAKTVSPVDRGTRLRVIHELAIAAHMDAESATISLRDFLRDSSSPNYIVDAAAVLRSAVKNVEAIEALQALQGFLDEQVESEGDYRWVMGILRVRPDDAWVTRRGTKRA